MGCFIVDIELLLEVLVRSGTPILHNRMEFGHSEHGIMVCIWRLGLGRYVAVWPWYNLRVYKRSIANCNLFHR